MPRIRVYHAQKPSFWQRQHANLACCREPNLIFALLTAQRIFAIKTRRTKPPAAISQDYLLGGCAFGASGILFIAEATATRKPCVLPRAKLVFCFANRAENLCYQNKTDKTSCRNFARLSAWWKSGGTPAPDVLRLRKISAYSKRSYTRYLFIRRRNWSRKATTGRSSVIAVKAIVLCHSEE